MASLAPELESLELRYRQGWDKTQSYEEALDNSYAADCDQRLYPFGPTAC